MTIANDKAVNQENAPFNNVKRIPIREFDPVAAEKELRARLEEIKRTLASIEAAKHVTQETLKLEFSI
jgi:hypothetical protein